MVRATAIAPEPIASFRARNVQAAADYETNPRSSTSLVYWTMNGSILRRLTEASPITTFRIGADDRITAPT
jgi:hypothetical protein